MVANKQNKNTAKGLAARAKALARKVRERSKNLSKNKALRSAIDSTLLDQRVMAVIPQGQMISKGYKALKLANRKTPTVSPCLKKWFTCLTNPFHQSAQGACIPAGGNIPTMRSMNYVRGDIVVGTSGVGFLQLIPSAYNDVVVGVVTTASFAGQNCQFFSAGGTNPWTVGCSPIYFTNARYPSTYAVPDAVPITAGVSSRLVGGGVRLYYTGTQLNMGGLMSVYTSPTHQGASTVNTSVATAAFQDPNTLGAYQETMIRPINREVVEYCLSPLLESELNFPNAYAQDPSAVDFKQSGVYPWSQSGYSYPGGITTKLNQGNSNIFVGLPTTVIVVTGVPGNVVHFEYAMHIESIGDLTEGMRMPADSDPVGVDSLMAALARTQISRNASTSGNPADILRKEMSAVVSGREARVSL